MGCGCSQLMRIGEMAPPKYLPMEIIAEILSRLPPKTLIQFTSVCKSWYALIKNPNFVSTHLNQNIRNPNYFVLSVNSKVCSLFSDNSFVGYDKIEIPFYSHPLTVQLKVVGSCHGIVCLTRDDSHECTREVFLWNPSIRKFKNLGQSGLMCSDDGFKDYRDNVVSVGFGFCVDKSVDDYRVVRIVQKRSVFGQPEVEVYSLFSDSWRTIGANVPCLIHHDDAPLFYSGALHWLGWSLYYLCWVILSFDLKDEVFRQMMLPPIIRLRSFYDAQMMELKGLLSLFIRRSDGMDNGVWSLWTMREYGVVDSWTKQMTISLGTGTSSPPFGFTKSGKLIFEQNCRVLRWHDPGNLQSHTLELGGPHTVDVAFTESLLLLDDGNTLSGSAI